MTCVRCNTTSAIRYVFRPREGWICKECSRPPSKESKFTKSRDWFRPHINDDITGEPIEITSKKQYKRICEENGVMARCLL